MEKKIIQPIKDFNKQSILFSDKVIHFAPENKNENKARLSIEATIVTI